MYCVFNVNEKEIMQGTMPGARRRGRPRMAWMDYISASEVTTLWRYTNLFIIIIIIRRGHDSPWKSQSE